jgi:hypothetical protein
MKNLTIIKHVSIWFIVLFAGSNLALAQCDEKKLDESCKGQMTEGFTFIKSFTIDPVKMENGKLEYSYIFSKDTQYVLALCSMADKSGKDVAVALYDNNRNLLFNSAENKNEPLKKLIYKCQTTGVHYLSFTFLNEKASCHQAQIGFKR